VSLGQIYKAVQDPKEKLSRVLADNGFPEDPEISVQMSQLLQRLLSAEIGVEWLEGDNEKAFLAFRRHNSRSTQLALKTEELKLSVLAYRFEPLLREFIDPIRADAIGRDLGRQTFTLKRLQDVIYRMLPTEYSGQRVLRIPSECVESSAVRLRATYELTRDYLIEHGLACDHFVSSPAMADILMSLFDKIPSAAEDDFAFRWMCHIMAGNVFWGRPHDARRTLKEVLRGEGYAQIQAAMTKILPSGPPSPFTTERLHPVPENKHKSTGPNGALYAMMSASRPAGLPDLASAAVFPGQRMRLERLCDKPEAGFLPHYALMSGETADIIANYGGWTREAYEALQAPDERFALHQLPIPPAGLIVEEVGDWLKTERTPLLARAMNEFLQTRVGPLDDRT
jgi:hypothetical protein